MILVLALLVVVIGLTWPSLSRLYGHHQLRQAADLVGVRLTSGRVYALESGLTYQFRFEPGGRRYLLVPYDREPDETGESTSRAMRSVGMLPDTASFEGGEFFGNQGTPIPDEWLSGLPDAADYIGASWSQPVLFYSDGTSSSGDLIIRDRNHQEVKLILRGLTGGVTVSSEGG